jgi:hypothetical protein
MPSQIVNLFVIMAIGVIIAMLVGKGANTGGTQQLFSGIANLWQIGVNGMLGNTNVSSTGTNARQASSQPQFIST